VECVNASSPPSEDREHDYDAYAPGQNVGKYSISLGGYGGTITRGFSIDNALGDDFRIVGNAFGGWAEPGIIWVMKDENRNGKADDTWYELKGNAEELGMKITRRYAVAYHTDRSWEDNLGNTGTLGSLQPTPSAPITLAGTLINRLGSLSGDWLQGYVDTGDILFDISDAVQVDGTPVYLDHIDFVRVQTGEHIYDNVFGEISTEINMNGGGFGTVWAETRSLNGVANGKGTYAYQVVNNSGYDLTVSFKDVTETLSVPRGTTLPYTSAESKLYFNYVGGNVKHSISGATLTITDG
jgi:hypothetical protein